MYVVRSGFVSVGCVEFQLSISNFSGVREVTHARYVPLSSQLNVLTEESVPNSSNSAEILCQGLFLQPALSTLSSKGEKASS